MPQDIWERLKLYLSEGESGVVTFTVVRGKIVGMAVGDAEELMADPRVRRMVKAAAAEVLTHPLVLDRLLRQLADGPRETPTSGKSLTLAQRP